MCHPRKVHQSTYSTKGREMGNNGISTSALILKLPVVVVAEGENLLRDSGNLTLKFNIHRNKKEICCR